MADFPAWIRATHWVNALFIGFLIRAGIQILGAYPRLYLDDHCTPGTEWLKLTRRRIPRTRPWTALQQEEHVSAWLAQPGGNNLGMGRHWHFFAATFWVLNGALYVVLLFATDEWRRLVPTSWSIVPDAWHSVVTYVTLGQPAATPGNPFDPLQQLTYFAVIFLLAPLLMLTAAAQSPAIDAQFPWYVRLFGGRQRARSLHFAGLVAFILFIIGHTVLVAYSGLSENLGDIVLGQHARHRPLAVGLGIALIAAIFAVYALTSWYSRRSPRQVQRALSHVLLVTMHPLSLRARSRQEYAASDISPYFIVNGDPPDTPDYAALTDTPEAFRDWRLDVRGLVAQPLSLSLADLHALPVSAQVTKHHCIQGWTGVASWQGVNLREIIARAQPLPTARYAVFTSYQLDLAGRPFYESVDARLIDHPQAMLAYAMNDAPLTIVHGAPLRLRIETELGFKMVKWLRTIDFVEDYRTLGDGMGGSREDNMYYEQSASI
jgi:DMSO/TMAO reductase YedYZ molybdopterin-dependent catalytic subunit/thiosulfate reductase cytochrome b subunit